MTPGNTFSRGICSGRAYTRTHDTHLFVINSVDNDLFYSYRCSFRHHTVLQPAPTLVGSNIKHRLIQPSLTLLFSRSAPLGNIYEASGVQCVSEGSGYHSLMRGGQPNIPPVPALLCESVKPHYFFKDWATDTAEFWHSSSDLCLWAHHQMWLNLQTLI